MTQKQKPAQAAASVAAPFPDSGPVSKNDIASFLRCSPDTVDRHVELSVLPAPVRFGTMLRWEAADVRACWLRACGATAPRSRKRNQVTA